MDKSPFFFEKQRRRLPNYVPYVSTDLRKESGSYHSPVAPIPVWSFWVDVQGTTVRVCSYGYLLGDSTVVHVSLHGSVPWPLGRVGVQDTYPYHPHRPPDLRIGSSRPRGLRTSKRTRTSLLPRDVVLVTCPYYFLSPTTWYVCPGDLRTSRRTYTLPLPGNVYLETCLSHPVEFGRLGPFVHKTYGSLDGLVPQLSRNTVT